MSTPSAIRLLDRQARGREAELVQEAIEPVLAARERVVLGEARSRYRSGQLHAEPTEAIGLIAELVAIDDVRLAIGGAVRKGRRAAESLLDSRPSDDGR